MNTWAVLCCAVINHDPSVHGAKNGAIEGIVYLNDMLDIEDLPKVQ